MGQTPSNVTRNPRFPVAGLINHRRFCHTPQVAQFSASRFSFFTAFMSGSLGDGGDWSDSMQSAIGGAGSQEFNPSGASDSFGCSSGQNGANPDGSSNSSDIFGNSYTGSDNENGVSTSNFENTSKKDTNDSGFSLPGDTGNDVSNFNTGSNNNSDVFNHNANDYTNDHGFQQMNNNQGNSSFNNNDSVNPNYSRNGNNGFSQGSNGGRGNFGFNNHNGNGNGGDGQGGGYQGYQGNSSGNNFGNNGNGYNNNFNNGGGGGNNGGGNFMWREGASQARGHGRGGQTYRSQHFQENLRQMNGNGNNYNNNNNNGYQGNNGGTGRGSRGRGGGGGGAHMNMDMRYQGNKGFDKYNPTDQSSAGIGMGGPLNIANSRAQGMQGQGPHNMQAQFGPKLGQDQNQNQIGGAGGNYQQQQQQMQQQILGGQYVSPNNVSKYNDNNFMGGNGNGNNNGSTFQGMLNYQTNNVRGSVHKGTKQPQNPLLFDICSLERSSLVDIIGKVTRSILLEAKSNIAPNGQFKTISGLGPGMPTIQMPPFSLKAVELANALRSRVGTDVLAHIRERFGGLLSVLELVPNIFQVFRIPKNDFVALVLDGDEPVSELQSVTLDAAALGVSGLNSALLGSAQVAAQRSSMSSSVHPNEHPIMNLKSINKSILNNGNNYQHNQNNNNQYNNNNTSMGNNMSVNNGYNNGDGNDFGNNGQSNDNDIANDNGVNDYGGNGNDFGNVSSHSSGSGGDNNSGNGNGYGNMSNAHINPHANANAYAIAIGIVNANAKAQGTTNGGIDGGDLNTNIDQQFSGTGTNTSDSVSTNSGDSESNNNTNNAFNVGDNSNGNGNRPPYTNMSNVNAGELNNAPMDPTIAQQYLDGFLGKNGNGTPQQQQQYQQNHQSQFQQQTTGVSRQEVLQGLMQRSTASSGSGPSLHGSPSSSINELAGNGNGNGYGNGNGTGSSDEPNNQNEPSVLSLLGRQSTSLGEDSHFSYISAARANGNGSTSPSGSVHSSVNSLDENSGGLPNLADDDVSKLSFSESLSLGEGDSDGNHLASSMMPPGLEKSINGNGNEGGVPTTIFSSLA